MLAYMSWILVGYGFAALLVHLLHRRVRRKSAEDAQELHYILISRNHGNQMEWYVRALSWYARLRGQCIRVTVMDQASQDDTLEILGRLRQESGISLNVVGLEESGGTGATVIDENPYNVTDRLDIIHVDLRVPKEAAKIPYVHVR